MPERGGDGFAREVVLRGPEAAHEDCNVGTVDCGASGRGQVIEVVADDGLECNADA